MNSQLRQKQRRGGPRPGKGRVAEWSKAADCKSVEVFLRRFESCLSHLFVVDFREEKRGIRQRRKANRAKLLWPFREVQLYRMLVREVGELLRSIDSPSISNPNENRSEIPIQDHCSSFSGGYGLLGCKPASTLMEPNYVLPYAPTDSDPLLDNITGINNFL
ncbi:hypothetical protein Tco_0850728, partial [Tanacetum coccineum]